MVCISLNYYYLLLIFKIGAARSYNDISKGLGATERVFELLEGTPNVKNSPNAITLDSLSGQITFKDISFAYPTRENSLIFNSLNLNIPPGHIAAVVGSSGSGKSTILSLLSRLYDPQEGQVMVDNHDIKEYVFIELKNELVILIITII